MGLLNYYKLKSKIMKNVCLFLLQSTIINTFIILGVINATVTKSMAFGTCTLSSHAQQ